MSNRKKIIAVNIDEDLVNEAQKLFKKLNLTTTSAIAIFLQTCVKEQGIPFMVTTKTKSEEESNN